MTMRRTPSARAIIFAGVIGGLTREVINQLLADAGLGAQAIPPATYSSIRANEVPAFLADPQLLGEYIFHPKPRSWLAARRRQGRRGKP
jgi:hypothetical protein